MGRIRPAISSGYAFSHDALVGSIGGTFRLLGCFRGGEMHGGCAISIIGRRSAGRPYPSLTPYLGVLYPSYDAKYVTEISNNKEIGSTFAVFLENEFDEVAELAFSPEVVDLQPFIWQRSRLNCHYAPHLSLTNIKSVLDDMDAEQRHQISLARRSRVLK